MEQLLGRPIQEELAMETGVDVAMDALIDVSTGQGNSIYAQFQ